MPAPASTDLFPDPSPTPSLPFAGAEAASAIPQLLATERVAAAAGDLALLGQLWSEDGQIIDQRGTADPADDYVWQGRAAIVNRYRLAVIPNPPPLLDVETLAALHIQVNGSEATLASDCDHWRFVYREGRWWLHELYYNSCFKRELPAPTNSSG